jgi:hypothetical protein
MTRLPNGEAGRLDPVARVGLDLALLHRHLEHAAEVR